MKINYFSFLSLSQFDVMEQPQYDECHGFNLIYFSGTADIPAGHG